MFSVSAVQFAPLLPALETTVGAVKLRSFGYGEPCRVGGGSGCGKDYLRQTHFNKNSLMGYLQARGSECFKASC